MWLRPVPGEGSTLRYPVCDRTTYGIPTQDKSLLDTLQDQPLSQILSLRAKLVTRNEELRRKDHIIAALTERIPELPPPAFPKTVLEGREKPTDLHEEGVDAVPETTADPRTPIMQPWWKRGYSARPMRKRRRRKRGE